MVAKAVTLPSMRYAGALRIASLADSIVTHEPYLEAHREDYGPDVLYRTLAGQFVLGRDYSKALKVQRLIKEEHARVLQEVDFLVTPTAPVGCTTHRRIDIYARRTAAPRAGAGVRYAGQVYESQQCDGAAGHYRPLWVHSGRSAHRRPVHRASVRRGAPIASGPRIRGGVPEPRPQARHRR